MVKLTYRREQILRFLHKFYIENGFPPTIREIAQKFELSAASTVHTHLKNLERAGLIERVHRTARGARLTADGRAVIRRKPTLSRLRMPAYERIRQLEKELAAHCKVLQRVPWETVRKHCPEATALMRAACQ